MCTTVLTVQLTAPLPPHHPFPPPPPLPPPSPAAGASLVVDNTFTPLAVTPTCHGADVVVHSLTKFVSGASDIIAGAVCGRAAFVASMMDLHTGVCVGGGGRERGGG